MEKLQVAGKIENIHSKTAIIFVATILFPLTAFGQLIQNPIVTPFFLELLDIIVKAIAAITGTVAVIVILSAAFLYMTAGGNVDIIKRAHKMILYSIAAVAVSLLLLALPSWIQNFFGSTAQQVTQAPIQQPPIQQPPIQQPPVQQPPIQQPPVQQPPVQQPSACANCTRVITQNVSVSPRACCRTSAPPGAAPGSWSCPAFESLLNCQVSNTHAQQLGQLAQAIPSANFWRVTEAWPPTVVHQNACHTRATCTDANFVNPAVNATPSNISNFIQQAQNAGITPIYEVTTQARRDSLVASGVPASNIQIVPGVPEHFSLYSCSNFQTGC